MAGEIFISYRRADEAWARLLHSQLRAQGVEAWYDAQVGPGQDWRIATAKALEASQIFVLLFSENAAQSSDIAKELAAATLEKKLIIPVRLENIAPKGAFLYELASRNWVNAYDDTEAKLAELAKGLAHLVRTGARDDSVLPFERGNVQTPAPPHKRTRAAVFIAGAAIVMAAALATVVWMYRSPAPPVPAPVAVRIAVLPFDTLGDDAALHQFAGGLEAEIVDQLSQNRLPVVSRQDGANLKGQGLGAAAETLNVAYAFTGTIERSGNELLVRVRLDDARQRVTVWSSEYQADARDMRQLQDEISTQTAQFGAVAVHYFALANGDTEAMSLLIKNAEYAYSDRHEDREADWDVTKKLAAKFPNTANFQSDFAITGAFLAVDSTPARAAELRASAKIEAQRALALDPRDSRAYFAQALLFPSVGHWKEREEILLQGLSVVPQDDLLTNHESNFLREVGRLKDAVAYGRQAQAAIPASANRDSTLLLALGATGDSFEADPLAQTALNSWPTHPAVWNARFQIAIFNSRWDAALAMLAPGAYVPLPDPVADAWRSAVTAAKSGNSSQKKVAVRKIAALLDPSNVSPALPPNEVLTAGAAIAMLAVLDDNDEAFAQAKIYLRSDSYRDSSFLFWPNIPKFRRDARFMPLAAQIGLVDYWRSTGKWPDFCNQPNWPYDCRKEALSLKSAK